MIKPLQVWKFIAASLQENIPVMLLYVLESKGSSPGRQGFFMAVKANGKMQGSIGGGIMEHKFVEMAGEQLKIKNVKLKIRKQVHNKSATKCRSGMICSGEQMVLIYQVQKNDKETIDAIILCLKENRNGTLIISPNKIQFSENMASSDFFFEMKSEDDWIYQEKIGYKNHLFIIGGGHCSLAFSKMMAMMDFYIHLFDDRQDLNTMEQNEFVHEKKIVNSYEEIKNFISSGENNYVVIMTFGYRTDDIAVRALLDKKFKYLGLLGSQKKIEELFNTYQSEGIPKEVLKRIHSPIGISIKSQTPEEIAISIAAEIIAVKNMV